MMKKIAMLIGACGVLFVLPLHAQDHNKFDKFTFGFGGGISTPLNPTAKYTGISGTFLTSAGYKINPKSSINGEFMWSGLPGSVYAIQPTKLPTVASNVYHLGANYRYQVDHIRGSIFGLYAIAGGGWYYRYITLNQDYVVPANTPCQPIYTWWGYSCAGGYVYSDTIAKKGTSGGGVNAGFGFSIGLSRNLKFFTETRYHYAWHANVPTTMIPVTMGLRFN
jgi:hypothetical protein